MSAHHSDPPRTVPRGFLQDPLVQSLWSAYWRQVAARGGDPHDPSTADVDAFWKEFLPAALREPKALVDEMHQERRAYREQARAARAAAEVSLAARIERCGGEGLEFLEELLAASQDLLREVHRRVRDGTPEVDWTRRALLLVYARGVQPGSCTSRLVGA
jgi:hypothetical protein